MATEEVNKRSLKGTRLSGVQLKLIGENLEVLQQYEKKLELVCTCEGKSSKVAVYDGEDGVIDIPVSDAAHLYRAGPCVICLRLPQGSAVITTASQNDASILLSKLESSITFEKKWSQLSLFNLRTEESSAKQYFQFYGYLSQQQNMLQDSVRTGTYQSAMLQNLADFKDKIVLDVGAGTGALSFFALQAGAKMVYAIEASNMAVHCQKLVRENMKEDKITVIAGKVEEINLPEKVDIIVSEPMGYMLFNERMLETYLHAKKWLKPNGVMFPTKAILYIAPFSDEALYLEQFSKANFWAQNSFHGIDLSSLRQEALEEYFKQPVLDTFDVRIVMAKPVGHTTDFLKATENDLLKITIPLHYKMWSTGMVHGLALWFDCAFCGSECSVWLSTAPFQPLTHWYQIRLLLLKPVFLHKDQELSGHLRLVANERLSYDITVELEFPGTNMKSTTSYDLKNPNFRYMTTPLPVPGTLYSNPTENYYQDYSTMQHQDQPPHSMSSTSHSLNPVASQAGISSTLININPVPTQLITSTPAVPQITNTLSPQLISSAQSLNPAAPHFVPLPLSDNKVAYHNGGGLLSTPRGQQMVYSQCSSGITGVMYNSVYSSKYGGHHWNQQYSSYY